MKVFQSISDSIHEGIRYKEGTALYEAIDINITSRCTLDCVFCECQRLDHNNDLSKDEFSNIASQLSSLGIGQVFLGGGEPFLRDDITEIIRTLKDYTLSVRMITNGSLPKRLDDKMLNLIDQCVDSIDISIDSSIPEQHNYLRNNAKAFDLALKSLERLSLLQKCRKTITAVITRNNLDGLAGLVGLGQRYSMDAVVFQPISDSSNYPELQPKKGKEDLFLGPAELCRLKDVLDSIAEECQSVGLHTNASRLSGWVFQYFDNRIAQRIFYHGMVKDFRCIVAFKRATIRHDGSVQLCALLPAFANIREKPLKDILYGSNPVKDRLRKGQLHPNCFKCFCGMDANLRFSMTYRPMKNWQGLLPLVARRLVGKA